MRACVRACVRACACPYAHPLTHSPTHPPTQVVRELLAAHVGEWAADPAAASFLLRTLRLPPAWLAEARTLRARYSGDDAGGWLAGWWWVVWGVSGACVCGGGGVRVAGNCA